jgi:uncharacterized phage protein (TIGR02218 family)
MIDVTTALAQLFESGLPLSRCNLYTITLLGGAVLRYTDSDMAVPYAGQVWRPGPLLTRSEVTTTTTVQVVDMSITINAGPEITINEVPLIAFIASGGLDDATVLVEQAFAGEGDTKPVGTVHVFAGRVCEIGGSGYEKTLTVRSANEALNLMIPRDVYQPLCRNALFDGVCGLAKSAYLVADSTTSDGDAAGLTLHHDLSAELGYYVRGRVTITSGPNTGITRSVRAHTASALEFMQPFPFPVGSGVSFLAWPGCDRHVDTCTSKFNNRLRFRAEPWIPTPETVT